MKKTVSILLFLGLFNLQIKAQEANVINTDRPGYSNTPSTVPHKAQQLESGWREDMFTIASLSYRTFPELLLKYGLAPNLELRFSQSIRNIHAIVNTGNFARPYFQSQRLSGPTAPVLGMKYRILRRGQGERTLSANIEVQFNEAGSFLFLPSSDDHNPVDVSMRVLYQHTFNETYALLHNTIYNSFGQDLSFTFNNLFQVSERGTLFLEAVPGIYLNRIGSNNAYFLNTDAGAIYQLKQNLQFDASFGLSFPTTEVGYGFFYNSNNTAEVLRTRPWFFALGFSALMD